MLNLRRSLSTKKTVQSIPQQLYFSIHRTLFAEQKSKNFTMRQVLQNAQDISNRFQYPFEKSIPKPLQDVSLQSYTVLYSNKRPKFLKLLSYANILQVIGLTLLSITILFKPLANEEPWQQYASALSLLLVSFAIGYGAQFIATRYILEIGLFLPNKPQIPVGTNTIMHSLSSSSQQSQLVQDPMLRIVTGGIFKNHESYFAASKVKTTNIQLLFPPQHRLADAKALEKVSDYFFFRLHGKKFFYLMDITETGAYLDRQKMFQLFGSTSKEFRI